MKLLPVSLILSLFFLLASTVLTTDLMAADIEELNSEKIISEMEKQLDLSREKWEQLKPVIEEKSKEMAEGIKESVEKGYAGLDQLTQKFDSMSKETEQKVKDVLSSEEAMRLRQELAKIDKEAIDQAKVKMIAKLNELLALTEEQAQKLKPVLEDSINQVAEKMQEEAQEGAQDWNEFKQELEKLTRDLYDKVQETLDDEQMEKLEKYNEDQKEDIKKTLFTV
ncbi:MAG: hypothetical protein KJO28_04240 [Desulfofustis sp.]|nr:hypothetical protein [Desulfofustis sp.]